MANLRLVSLDEAKIIKLLEEAGAKSLGNVFGLGKPWITIQGIIIS